MTPGLAALGPLVAATIVGTDRRIHRQLRSARAGGPDAVVALATRSPLVRWRLERLTAAGAVRVAPGGGYYLDEAGWLRHRRERRRRAAVVIGLVLLGAALLLWRQR